MVFRLALLTLLLLASPAHAALCAPKAKVVRGLNLSGFFKAETYYTDHGVIEVFKKGKVISLVGIFKDEACILTFGSTKPERAFDI